MHLCQWNNCLISKILTLDPGVQADSLEAYGLKPNYTCSILEYITSLNWGIGLMCKTPKSKNLYQVNKSLTYMWPAWWTFPNRVDVHNSSAFQIITKCTTHILLPANFIQTVYTAAISWAKGYCGAVTHKSAQLVNSIKLPSTPHVSLETSVNLLPTTIKCLQMVNTAYQS